MEKATDILAETKKETKKESWEKSIGSMSSLKSQKNGLGIVVKKKTDASNSKTQPGPSTAKPAPPSNNGPSSLSLLGAYSDSSDSEEDST